MNTPIKFGGPSASVITPGAARAATGASFASRLGGLGGLAAGAQVLGQTLGRQVINTALGGLPPVVQNLAQNALSAATGGALGAEDAKMAEVVDMTRFYLMMNAIFDAANAPVVERDNS